MVADLHAGHNLLKLFRSFGVNLHRKARVDPRTGPASQRIRIPCRGS